MNFTEALRFGAVTASLVAFLGMARRRRPIGGFFLVGGQITTRRAVSATVRVCM